MGRAGCSVKCALWRKQWEVRSEKCGVWSWSLQCEERSVKCDVWSVRFGVWRKQWEMRSVKCGVWSVIFFRFWLLANNKAWQMQFLRFGIEIRFWKLVLYSLRQCMCSFSSARLCANCAYSCRRCLGHACNIAIIYNVLRAQVSANITHVYTIQPCNCVDSQRVRATFWSAEAWVRATLWSA